LSDTIEFATAAAFNKLSVEGDATTSSTEAIYETLTTYGKERESPAYDH
jgi:hypothetical protein